MKRVIRCMALAVVVSANVGMSNAALHSSSFGTYSTAVAESRLFVDDSVITKLRCDLFFTTSDSDQKLTAPKGSVINQSVPAFVWQYSGLLPVTDYLKTVAIHSVGSDKKERSWQDVQLTFYKGLRSEGAREADAKIAYAGAYAFAPRWPLVELVDITVPERDKKTRLYSVKYTPASAKSVSVDDYRSLSRNILSSPEDVSLEDIREVVDATDATGQGLVSTEKAEGKRSLFGLFSGAKSEEIKDPVEELFVDLSGNEKDIDVAELERQATEVLGGAEAIEPVPEGVVVDIVPIMFDALPAMKNVGAVRGAIPAIWKKMPDGTEMLVQIGS